MLPVTTQGNFVYMPDGEVLTDFFWHEGKFGCIQGPIGSGTSSASCMKIWRLACDQEADYDGIRRTRWIITRDTYKELRETTVRTWLEWFPEDTWGQFIRSEPMFHKLIDPNEGGPVPHPSGDGTFVDCEVIFVAIPDADVAEEILASYEITGFFRNEGQFCEKEVIDELLSRCSRYPSMKNGPGATWFGGWMDMNAPVEGHWVPYMRGDLELPPEWTDDEKAAMQAPEDWDFFVQPPGLIETLVEGRPVYKNNPKAENQQNLKETYMEKIQGKAKDWIDRRVLNKVGLYMEGKAVYPTFLEVDHVLPENVEHVGYMPIIVGLDFGREPAAAFLQEQQNKWILLSELIGNNESAELFAPRVKKHLSQHYPNMKAEFWGDPRGGDGGQNTETTAFDIYNRLGMPVFNATEDNDVELRRSTVTSVLGRRNGFGINPKCLVAKRGFAGGYHYRKIKGLAGMYSPKPVKNVYSHIIEAIENGLIGGGEGTAIVSAPDSRRKKAHVPAARNVRLRRVAR